MDKAYRGAAPGADLTDRGYTGHRENRDLELTYMNTRYCLPEIGRFASADTIVPEPLSPQSFNRYGYALNNPVNFTDPTGHGVCDISGNCQLIEQPSVWSQMQRFGIKVTADPGESWTLAQKRILVNAVSDVDKALGGIDQFRGYRPGQAFQEVYENITFHRSADTTWTDSGGVVHNIDYGAFTRGSRIDFYDDAISVNPLDPKFLYNVVHELGHAFNYVTVQGSDANPYNDLEQALGGALPSRNKVRIGMEPYPLQQNTRATKNENYELFADGFLNWTYGSFNSTKQGVQTSDWFDTQMPLWVSID